MTTQLSNNDPDHLLAKQLGKALAEKLDWSAVDDPLIQELATYRQKRLQKTANERANSAEIWSRIDQQINLDSASSSARILSMAVAKWAAAALILIAALAGAYYFQFLQGPTLIAASGSTSATFQLADGSSATLRPHTELYQITESQELLSYKLTGEAYFEVTPDPAREFQVETGNGRVTVLGTKFIVSSWGLSTKVFLEEGSVQFTSESTTDPLVLEPGQAAAIDRRTSKPILIDESADEFTDWLQNELVFTSGRSADRILREVEQHFGITIEASQALLNTTLSGSISLENREKALEYLALSLDAALTRTAENRYRLTKNGE